MTKDVLLSRIDNGDFDAARLRKWIKALPGSNGSHEPAESRVGDVYMHPVFKHPYLLLKHTDEGWLCTLMTSNGDFKEVLEKCQSRFFEHSYITKVMFTITDPDGVWCNVYDNVDHVTSIHKKLRKIFKK